MLSKVRSLILPFADLQVFSCKVPPSKDPVVV